MVAHCLQLPWLQNMFAAHDCVPVHTEHPFVSVVHVSVPLPLHRELPTVQLVPQVPHAPPEQKLAQVCECCQLVQPLGSATQVSTPPPLQRAAPAVHVVLHAEHLPLTQWLPD